MADDPMPKELIRDPKTGLMRPPKPGEDTEPAAPKASLAKQTINGLVKALGGGDQVSGAQNGTTLSAADRRYGKPK